MAERSILPDCLDPGPRFPMISGKSISSRRSTAKVTRACSCTATTYGKRRHRGWNIVGGSQKNSRAAVAFLENRRGPPPSARVSDGAVRWTPARELTQELAAASTIGWCRHVGLNHSTRTPEVPRDKGRRLLKISLG